MKIAQITCTFPPYTGGIGNVAYNFAKVLSLQGNEVTVLTPEYRKSDKISDLFIIERIKPILKYGNAAFLPQLFFKLRKYDIIHFHYPFFGGAEIIWLAKLVFRKKIKLYIHYHMDVVGLPLFIRPLAWPSKIIFRSLVKQAEIVTCGSLDYIENSQIKKVYDNYKDKFLELSFGVDLEKIRSDNSINKSGHNILFVGALDKAHYFKGLDLLIQAVSKIKDLDWKLYVVGGGDLLLHYKKFVKEVGAIGKIKFLGKVNDEELSGMYRKSDFLVLPSINRNEAFGLVLLEAMANGTAVLASDLPGVRSVFNNGKEGLLFKTNDIDDLIDKIRKMLTNKELTRKMGLAGGELVKEKYDWVKIGNKLNNLYTKTINKYENLFN